MEHRLLFLKNCSLIAELPLRSKCDDDKDQLGRQDLSALWKDLPTDFFSSLDKLRRAHALLEELHTIPTGEQYQIDEEASTSSLYVAVNGALLVQNMSWILVDALRAGQFMTSRSSQLENTDLNSIATWVLEEVSQYRERWTHVVDTIPFPVVKEYQRRPESILNLEKAARQVSALHDICSVLLDANVRGTKLSQMEVTSLEQANNLSFHMLQAMKTVTWPLKWGMPNSTMVQLVNKSISQRKATILGDTLVSFLLSAFDLSNISPETNFIRLLSKSPMQRPQAAAELLLYLVLWSPWTASHADDVERTLLAPEDAAWVRAMSIICHTVSFASVQTDATATKPEVDRQLGPFKHKSELTADEIRELQRLWSIAEARTKEPMTSALSDMMVPFHEHLMELIDVHTANEPHEEGPKGSANQNNPQVRTMLYKRDETRSAITTMLAQLKDEEEHLRSVESQLQAVQGKLASSFDQLQLIAKNSGPLLRMEITPQDEEDLREAMSKSIGQVFDETGARGMPSQPTSETGKDAPTPAGGEFMTVRLQRRANAPEEAIRMRLAGDPWNFKQLKEKCCRFANLNPSLYELYHPVEDAVWYDQADVWGQLKGDQRAHELVVLRRRKKKDGKYVKMRVVGDDGALEIANVRKARISELTLEQLQERERLVHEDNQKEAQQVLREMIRYKGYRRSSNDRALSLGLNLILLVFYIAYVYARYASNIQETSLSVNAIKSTALAGSDEVLSQEVDVYDLPVSQFFLWMTQVFAKNLIAATPRTGEIIPASFSRTFDENVAFGPLTLTQIRSSPHPCREWRDGQPPIERIVCASYDFDNADYGPGWTPLNETSVPVPGFTYSPSLANARSVYSETGGRSFGPGGYSVRLVSPNLIEDTATRLASQQWLDDRTRALIISAIVYNVPFESLTWLQILFEFSPSGYRETTVRVFPIGTESSSFSSLFEAARILVVSIYGWVVFLLVRRLIFHRLFHSMHVYKAALKNAPWISVIILLLLLAEIPFRFALDHENDRVTDISSAALAEFSAATTQGMVNATTLERLRRLDSIQALEKLDLSFSSWLTEQSRSIASVCVFFMCLKVAILLGQCSNTNLLFFRYMRSHDCVEALLSVGFAFATNMLGLAVLAVTIVGDSSSHFTDVFRAYASLILLITSPFRLFDDRNPFEISDHTEYADGPGQKYPFLLLVIMFEFVIMIIIWSLIVSIFVEGYANASTRHRVEQSMEQRVRALTKRDRTHHLTHLLDFLRPSKLIRGTRHLLQDLRILSCSMLSIFKEIQQERHSHHPAHLTYAHKRRKRQFERALRRMGLRFSAAEQLVVLKETMTEEMLEEELVAEMKSFGMIPLEAEGQVKPLGLETSASTNPTAQAPPAHAKQTPDLEEAATPFRNTCGYDLYSVRVEEESERAASRYSINEEQILSELQLQDETYSVLDPSHNLPRPAAVKQSLVEKYRVSRNDLSATGATCEKCTSTCKLSTSKYSRLEEDTPDSAPPDPVCVRTHLQRRLPDDREAQIAVDPVPTTTASKGGRGALAALMRSTPER